MSPATEAKPKKANPYKTNAEKVREKYKTMASDDRWFKPKPGKHTIRILPPWGEAANGEFYYEGALHYGFKIGGRDRAIPCLAKANRGKCPICIFVEKLKNSQDDDHKELMNRLRMRTKYWVNLIDRNQPDKVLMYGMGKKQIDPIMEAFDDDDLGDVTDPDEGHDCRFTREGTTQYDTRYKITVRPKPSPLGLDDWQEKLHQLDTEVLEFMASKEIVKHLVKNYGDVMEEVGLKFASQKEEEPKKPGKKKPKDEDEEDDKDEDEDEDKDSDNEDDD